MQKLFERVPNGAVKLAPGALVPADWNRRCELEWIGHGHECKQQVAWHGELAQSIGRHRAAVLGRSGVSYVVGIPGPPVTAETIGRYVFDPHPAVVAARLVPTMAAEHGMESISNGTSYLTGDHLLICELFSTFEVLDVLPLDERRLRRYVAAHRIGHLEIKKRGLDIDPAVLGRKLRPRGSGSATLLLTRWAGRRRAIVGRRILQPASGGVDHLGGTLR
jgi:hypothetical protein